MFKSSGNLIPLNLRAIAAILPKMLIRMTIAAAKITFARAFNLFS